MRFIIHGAGAVGSLIGGALAESGAEVVLIARQAHANAIKHNGLLLKTPNGERRISNLSVVTAPAQITPRPDDLLVLTVKTQNTAHAVQELHDVFPVETPILCLQNSVRNEELAARRFMHVYGGVAALCVTLLEPGVVAQTLANTISLGNYPFGNDALCQALAEQFRRAGFTVTTHESIMAVKWSKLILNLHNATFAILDQHLQLGLVTPAVCDFMADVEEEALHVLNVAGISLEDPDNPIEFPQRLAQLRAVEADPEKIYEAEQIPFALRTYPSTWADLKRKRGETEAGFFNGEIILLGEKFGLPTPYNATLLNLVETMAAERAEPGGHSLAELNDLVEQRRMKMYNSDQ